MENHVTPYSPELSAALESVQSEKAGILPPFLAPSMLQDCLASWDRLYENPRVAWCQDPPRYLMGPEMYLEPAFAAVAAHPIILDAARRVLDADVCLASYHIVATPPNAERPLTEDEVNRLQHIDHIIYSQVPVDQSPDNVFVCAWVNFHDMTPSNGPLCVAAGTDKFNVDWHFFKARPALKVADMHWGRLARLNIGPAGTTAVYSGKTWHCATNNCSTVTRKGLQIMFTPVAPKTKITPPWFDSSGLSAGHYEQFKTLIAGRVPIPPRSTAQEEVFRDLTGRELEHERKRTDSRYVRPCVRALR
jgi:hypothetical protein